MNDRWVWSRWYDFRRGFNIAIIPASILNFLLIGYNFLFKDYIMDMILFTTISGGLLFTFAICVGYYERKHGITKDPVLETILKRLDNIDKKLEVKE